MTASEWIDSLRGQTNADLSLEEACDVQKMIVHGDLHHIDGLLVTALAELAHDKTAEVGEAAIVWDKDYGEWFIMHGRYCRHDDDAIQAVLSAITGPTRYGTSAPGWRLTAAARAEDEIERGCQLMHLRAEDAA